MTVKDHKNTVASIRRNFQSCWPWRGKGTNALVSPSYLTGILKFVDFTV